MSKRSMTSSALNEIAHQWFAAFNERNVEKLLSLYDDNAQHYSPNLKALHPETNGLIQGKEALRAWWQGAFDRLPSLHYKMVRLAPNKEKVFMEYTRHADGEEDRYVGELLEFRNGLIISSTVFTH